MIIFRYLGQQILQVTVAISLILLSVGLISRFIQYLGQAVSGDIASDVLFLLMFYRLPDFFLVIVPLAFLLSILLVYGRMSEDNEIVILMNSGISQRRLLGLTLLISIIVFLFMGLVSLSLAPWGVRNVEQISSNQEQLTELDLMIPGQFQTFGGGSRVTYTETISAGQGVGRRLEKVFVALSQERESSEERSSDASAPRIFLAEVASPVFDDKTGARLMRMENVLQYDGNPGKAEFAIAQFDVHSLLLPEPTRFEPTLEEGSIRTLALINSDSLRNRAELQWRVSIMLLIPILVFIAVPLSRVHPREGRYGRLIPAVILYAAYFFLLQFARDAVSDGELDPRVGLWPVHMFFIMIGGALYYFPNFGTRRSAKV